MGKNCLNCSMFQLHVPETCAGCIICGPVEGQSHPGAIYTKYTEGAQLDCIELSQKTNELNTERN